MMNVTVLGNAHIATAKVSSHARHVKVLEHVVNVKVKVKYGVLIAMGKENVLIVKGTN